MVHFIYVLKFPKKVSSRHPQKYSHKRIDDGLAWRRE